MARDANGKLIIDFLVVDDQDTMLQAVRNILKTLFVGKEIVMARNGKEALKILKESATGFLITDWTMPQMTGIELVHLVRNNSQLHDLPTMMISDETDKDKFLFAMEEGVDGFQVKPFTQGKLMTAIGSIVEARATWTPLQKNICRLRRLMLLKQYDKCIVIAQKMLSDVVCPEVNLILGESFYLTGEYKNARNILEKFVSAEKNGKAIHLFGLTLMAEGEYEKALPYLQESVAKNPLNYNRKIDVGKIYLELGMKEEADEIFNSIIRDNPTDLSLVGAGNAFLKKGDLQKADNFFSKASAPIPETAAIFNQYAIELRRVGNYDKSIQQYKKCLKILPDNEAFLFNMARAYLEKGDFPQARVFFSKVHALYPSNEKAMLFIKHLDEKSKP